MHVGRTRGCREMATVELDITMSLDGFVAGPEDGPEHGLGLRGGERLHNWLFTGDTARGDDGFFKTSDGSTDVLDEFLTTAGAFLVGRRMFDITQGWGGSPPLKVPTFVVTHHVPEEFAGEGSVFTFVTEGIESAVEQAKAAAGDKKVSIGGGASIAQQCIRAGLVDVIQIHLAPLLLGEGVRLFGDIGAHAIELEPIRVVDAPGIAHLRYRVTK